MNAIEPNKNPLNSGKPLGAILSESSRDTGSVQRLTAETERLWSGYRKVNTAGQKLLRLEIYEKEKL